MVSTWGGLSAMKRVPLLGMPVRVSIVSQDSARAARLRPNPRGGGGIETHSLHGGYRAMCRCHAPTRRRWR
eukprot:2811144-Prymnesium_polylepis.1